GHRDRPRAREGNREVLRRRRPREAPEPPRRRRRAREDAVDSQRRVDRAPRVIDPLAASSSELEPASRSKPLEAASRARNRSCFELELVVAIMKTLWTRSAEWTGPR